MLTKIIQIITILFATTVTVFGQSTTQDDDYKKHFIGSTLFVIATPISSPSPEYLQLNYGYRITTKDILSVEAITWAYHAPLGIPYGPDKANQNNNFPGKVKAYGIGLSYKRFLWKGGYIQVHTTALKQHYLDTSDKKIQSGFQLFNTLRFGYHINVFKKRIFIEPSIAFTSWPINTNLPNAFQMEEDRWNKFFLFEPGLHFGINF